MKVLMVGPVPPMKGGVSKYCQRQFEELKKSVDIELVSFKSPYPAFLYPGQMDKMDSVVDKKIKFSFKWYNPISWLIPAFSLADIFHYHWWSYYFFPMYLPSLVLLKLRRKRVIFTLHNVVEYETNFIDRLFRKIVFSFPDMFIAHSDDNKKQLANIFGVSPRKISVLPIGLFDFYGDVMDKNLARKKLGLGLDEKVILYFGQIREYKGVDDLLEAFSLASNKIKNLRLVIAGKSWVDWNKYQEIINRNKIANKVILKIGYIPDRDVKHYFSAADLVVLPYKDFEAQSGVGSIAIGFGKPLLVSDTGGLPDLVNNRQQYIFGAGDVNGLSEKVCGIFEKGIISHMEKQAIAKKAELSWDSIIGKTIKIYGSLIKR